jgi:hypothetical protein
MPRLAPAAVLAAAAVLSSACDSGSPTIDPQVNFNIATRSTAATAAGATLSVSAPETFTDGTNTLVIDRVDLVLREIELKRSAASADCGEAQTEDACEELEVGPVLVSLPLGVGGAARAFSVIVAPGSYDKVEFEIHSPSSSDDAAFIQANPELDGASVRVSGSYNGVPFDFVSDLNAEQELALIPPLVVSASGATDLTLFVDLDGWFRDAGGSLIDPATAASGQPNEDVIKQNIQRALNAFEDENRDGADDHGGVDDGSNDT